MTTHSATHHRLLPALLLTLLALVWGSSFILMKRALVVFSPLQVAALRVIFAALILAPFVPQSLREIEKKHWKYLFVAGILGNGLPAIFFTTAQRHISSSTAALLNSLTPLFTLLVGVLAFRLVVRRGQVIGVVMGFLGAASLILAARGEIGAKEGSSLWYAVLPILATLCYGINMNIISRNLQGLKPITISALALWVLLCFYVPALLATGFIAEFPALYVHSYFWWAIACLLFLAGFGTALSNALHTRLIQISSPVIASSVTYLIPIVALLWGLLDGEVLSVLHFIGIATILCGIYLVNKRN
jgi:drug/metabolite transporter (DMT)-like permease